MRASTEDPTAHDIVSSVATADEVRRYWEQHIHDLEITSHPVGSRGFFDDLDQYHFEKLHHLLRLVDFNGYRGKAVREGRGRVHWRGYRRIGHRSREGELPAAGARCRPARRKRRGASVPRQLL